MSRPLVVHHGGGTNSTAMLVGFVERGIKPDLILFADTGGEKPETYSFLDKLNLWLTDHDFPRIITVRYNSLKDNTLEAECERLEIMPSIVYGHKNCSQKWKIDPQKRYLNKWPPAIEAWKNGETIIGAVGFDKGEIRRVRPNPDPKIDNWYPLVEWGWFREDCQAAIARVGLPSPGKSACFYCPSSKKSEVIWLSKEHPELFDRAVAMERRAKAKTNEEGDSVLRNIDGLGRHWSWEELVAGSKEADAAPESVEIECVCFDGDDNE